MTPRKRPPDPGLKGRPRGRSLRDQVKALPPGIAPSPSPGRGSGPTARAARPAAPAEGQSFKELAAGVQPLPVGARSPPLPGPPLPIPTRGVPPKLRLWVERQAGVVRARAEGVPARLLEDLRAGRVVPRRELDLHRRSAAEARQMLDDGVRRARQDGVSCLLVVCGRGKHSGADGPVLPDVAAERLSEELASEILAFCTAPRKWGGEGALIVRLRPVR